MAAVPDFEDLIKQIKPSASAESVAAATIALRLLRAQLGSGGNSVMVYFDGATTNTTGTGNFNDLVANIKNQIGAI